jgi:hypothetical protein
LKFGLIKELMWDFSRFSAVPVGKCRESTSSGPRSRPFTCRRIRLPTSGRSLRSLPDWQRHRTNRETCYDTAAVSCVGSPLLPTCHYLYVSADVDKSQVPLVTVQGDKQVTNTKIKCLSS